MFVNLTFTKDTQGWSSEYNGKLVVADRYSLNPSLEYSNGGRLGATAERTARLEELFGFYVAYCN
jgi:hypothetical protein